MNMMDIPGFSDCDCDYDKRNYAQEILAYMKTASYVRCYYLLPYAPLFEMAEPRCAPRQLKPHKTAQKRQNRPNNRQNRYKNRQRIQQPK